jgi:hypothetical protein
MQTLMPRMMTQCLDLDGLGDGVGVGLGLDDRVGAGLELLGGTDGEGDDLLGWGDGVEE